MGRGGCGVVYRAYDPMLDRQVAIKAPILESHAKRDERFLREAKAAGRLRHPNIVAVFESGRIDDTLYIASEYGADRAQILDFGLAKPLNDDDTLTMEGSVLGTPAYMSPEHASDEGNVGPAADQYSRGVVLYELLSDRKPFVGTLESILAQHIKVSPARLTAIDTTIHKDLEAVCFEAMEKLPGARYPDCAAFADDLDAWLRGEPTKVCPLNARERIVRWIGKEPVLARASKWMTHPECESVSLRTTNQRRGLSRSPA